MKPSENLSFNENLFTLSSGVTSTMSEETIFRIGKSSSSIYSPALQAMLEQPVNNYLKSQEEMEREFCFVINSRDSMLSINTDGYINIHNPEEKFSGYMEENY
jgi:hypothetical protein